MTKLDEVICSALLRGNNMNKFSQFLGIHRGKYKFKQARNAILVQGGYNPYPDCTKYTIVVTGEETFNFQAANNTMYYKNSDFISVPHDNIVFASCTHFNWGSDDVISTMKDGEFIFNYTQASGIGTGNVSFKNDTLFTDSSTAKAWFREQAANGTPVTITAYVKK